MYVSEHTRSASCMLRNIQEALPACSGTYWHATMAPPSFGNKQLVVTMVIAAYWGNDFLRRQKGKIYEATASGCAFNLRSISGPRKGNKMGKAWHIKSTLPTIEQYLDRKCTCPCGYKHAEASGRNTAHTG